MEVLRTVWVQQFTRTAGDAGEEVAWRGADDLPPSGILLASPYDPQARYAKQRGSAWGGYKVHVSESYDDSEESKRPRLITHMATIEATVNEAVVVEEVHDRLHAKDLLPREHLLDAGYTSAELLVTASRAHGAAVVGGPVSRQAPAWPTWTAPPAASCAATSAPAPASWFPSTSRNSATCVAS